MNRVSLFSAVTDAPFIVSPGERQGTSDFGAEEQAKYCQRRTIAAEFDLIQY
jgi:hypothetical protein